MVTTLNVKETLRNIYGTALASPTCPGQSVAQTTHTKVRLAFHVKKPGLHGVNTHPVRLAHPLLCHLAGRASKSVFQGFLKHCFVLLLTLFCLPVLALPLQTYDIEYQTKARGFTIKTLRKLDNKGAYFELSQITSTLMMQTSEKSTFSVNEKGEFSQRSFTYERKIMGNNKSHKTDYFPAKKTATFQIKGEKAKQVTVPAEIYDIFSYQEKLRQALVASQGKTTNFTFNVLERNRVRQYQFKQTGTERIATKLGEIDTVRIERVRDNSTKKTTTWLAKNFGYIVVKVQHKQEGEPEYQLNIVKGIFDNRDIIGVK